MDVTLLLRDSLHLSAPNGKTVLKSLLVILLVIVLCARKTHKQLALHSTKNGIFGLPTVNQTCKQVSRCVISFVATALLSPDYCVMYFLEAARVLLSARLLSNLFAVLLCLVLHLLDV